MKIKLVSLPPWPAPPSTSEPKHLSVHEDIMLAVKESLEEVSSLFPPQNYRDIFNFLTIYILNTKHW